MLASGLLVKMAASSHRLNGIGVLEDNGGASVGEWGSKSDKDFTMADGAPCMRICSFSILFGSADMGWSEDWGHG